MKKNLKNIGLNLPLSYEQEQVAFRELYRRHGKKMYVMSARDYNKWNKILKKHPKVRKELQATKTDMTPLVITPPGGI